jgi:hypothetical protein
MVGLVARPRSQSRLCFGRLYTAFEQFLQVQEDLQLVQVFELHCKFTIHAYSPSIGFYHPNIILLPSPVASHN